uniref:Uncharacterized protein n=1 Tax=Arundo donax TaxID=35708 RepID=A0A0A9D6F2_ARUDO
MILAGKSASIKICSGSLRCSYPGFPRSLSSLKNYETKYVKLVFFAKKQKHKIIGKNRAMELSIRNMKLKR